MRKRAALLTPAQQTNSQYNVPEIGTKIAYKTNRPGVAEWFADPTVHKSVEGDLALLDAYNQLLRDLELAIVKLTNGGLIRVRHSISSALDTQSFLHPLALTAP